METETPTPMAVILGGQDYVAKMRDGTEEPVTIRQLTVREISKKWLMVSTDEAGQVELYCGKDEGWDDKLTIESHEEIVRIGGDLNRPMIARWGERRRADLVELQSMTKGIALPSPTSSSPAGASLGNLPPK